MKNKLKISRPLIIIGVLKAHIKSPLMLFFQALISVKKLTECCDIDLPIQFIKSNGLIVSLYINLQKKFTKEKAFEIVRTAVITTGFATQQNALNCTKDSRTFENLIKNQKIMKNQGAAKYNTMVINEETKERYHYEVTRCMFYEFFDSLATPELTRIFCDLDNAIFSSYSPNDITFGRGGHNKTIPDGADKCTFIMTNNIRKNDTSKY